MCDKYGIGLVVWSPLAQGVLTGKYNDGIPADSRGSSADPSWFAKQIAEDRIARVRKLSALAADAGTTMAALALAWAMKHRAISSVITGATKPDHVHENLKALDVTITPDLDAAIEDILQNKPVRRKFN